MQIQTPVIHVNRTHHGRLVVADKGLGMEEARRILVNPHACLQKHRIIGTGQLEDSLLIRNARRYDPHIHSPFGRQTESRLHLVIHDQVGSEDIHIILRVIQDVQVHIFTQALVVQRRIAVGLYKALTLEGFRMPHMGPESLIGFVRMAFHIRRNMTV